MTTATRRSTETIWWWGNCHFEAIAWKAGKSGGVAVAPVSVSVILEGAKRPKNPVVGW